MEIGSRDYCIYCGWFNTDEPRTRFVIKWKYLENVSGEKAKNAESMIDLWQILIVKIAMHLHQ